MAPTAITEDYYKILEVEQHASADEIVRAYKRLALKIHPDRNSRHDATASFQLIFTSQLSRAYETLKDESQRRHYDLYQYPTIRKQQPTPQEKSQGTKDREQIHQLRKSKEERAAAWRIKKSPIDSTIFELQREVRRVEQQIKNLNSIAAAEIAKEALKNSWTTWLLTPFSKKQEETQEQKDLKDRAKQERRLETDMKERRLDAAKAKLKDQENILRTLQQQFDIATAKDDANIAMAEKRIADAERARQERIRRQQQEEQAKREREEAERLRKEQAERDAAWMKAWQETQERQRQYAEQQAAEIRRRREVEQRRVDDFNKRQAEEQARHQTKKSTRESSCGHHGWWPKVQGRTNCPECDEMWTYLLECPGCQMKRCPRCQSAIRGQRRKPFRGQYQPAPHYEYWDN